MIALSLECVSQLFLQDLREGLIVALARTLTDSLVSWVERQLHFLEIFLSPLRVQVDELLMLQEDILVQSDMIPGHCESR